LSGLNVKIITDSKDMTVMGYTYQWNSYEWSIHGHSTLVQANTCKFRQH